jgi:hypothetical protein
MLAAALDLKWEEMLALDLASKLEFALVALLLLPNFILLRMKTLEYMYIPKNETSKHKYIV